MGPVMGGWKLLTIWEERRNARYGGPDTCWFQGSPYPKFEGPSGASWDVGPGNIWGADVIGYGHLMVDYYRANNRAPCGTYLDQDMVINMPGLGWFRYKYVTNKLGAGFTMTHVWSERAGVRVEGMWP
jgi:hypothetical protein